MRQLEETIVLMCLLDMMWKYGGLFSSKCMQGREAEIIEVREKYLDNEKWHIIETQYIGNVQ